MQTEQPQHRLYLLNLDDDAQQVDLEVVRQATNETVIDDIYEIPEERGAKFSEVAHWDETYEVAVALDSGPSETFSWETGNCDSGEGKGGSRSGSTRIEPGARDLSFVTDLCDTGGTEVATGSATHFEVQEPETQ